MSEGRFTYECPECGILIGPDCHCRPGFPPYDNGDRSEDIEAGLVHGDGGEAIYLTDNEEVGQA